MNKEQGGIGGEGRGEEGRGEEQGRGGGEGEGRGGGRRGGEEARGVVCMSVLQNVGEWSPDLVLFPLPIPEIKLVSNTGRSVPRTAGTPGGRVQPSPQ